MERIRPPYQPEDDKPFGGERWGCFWLIAIFVGLIIASIVIRALLDVEGVWLYALQILLGVAEAYIIVNYFTRRYRR